LSKQVAAKVSKVEYELIRRLVKSGLYINSSDFVRDAMRRRLAEISSTAKTPTDKLKQQLYDYMRDHDGLIWPDEAARDLGYSILDILEALKKLETEGRAVEAEGIHIEA
jgi:Arc/MetJ-type ribon-helix-helix transcriptional regulator